MYEELPFLPVNRPVLPVERLGAIFEVIICSGFPSQFALSLVLHSFGLRALTADGSYSPPFVFTLSLVDAILVVGLVVMFLRAHNESVRSVLFGDRPVLGEALIGLAIVPALFAAVLVVIVVILRFAPQMHNVPHNPLERLMQSRGDALIFAAVVTIAGGVREEVQRAFIVHRFGRYLGGAGWGIAIYSAFFGLGHVEQGLDAVVVTAFLGLLWGLLYLARRSIVASMVSHAGFDLAQLAKYLTFAVR